MEQQVAINLIRKGILAAGKERWADLGAGEGSFTFALSSLLRPESLIYAIDNDKKVLEALHVNSGVRIEKIIGDFRDEDIIPQSLDGLVLANSIHYIDNKRTLIEMLLGKLNKQGRIIIIEYDMDNSNRWVPFPLSFLSLVALFGSIGVPKVEKIGEVPSRLNTSNMYAAVIFP